MFIYVPILVFILCIAGLFIPKKHWKLGATIIIFITIVTMTWGLYLGYFVLTAEPSENLSCLPDHPQIMGYCQNN